MQEEQHQADLRVLRTRLEALDKVQHQQLADLTSDLTPRGKRDPLLTSDLTPREKRDPEKDVDDLKLRLEPSATDEEDACSLEA